MAAVKEYKCLSCNAGLEFDPPSGQWKCGYCYSKFTKEQLDKVHGEDLHDELDQETEELDAYHCTSCGAELIADATTSATFCLYCKSPTIIKQRFSGRFKPHFVIPFRLTKKDAKSLYSAWIKKKIFAPSSFKQDEEIDKITGIYAPFWMFDCIAHGRTAGKGNIVSHWRSGDYEYTKTKIYHVEREGDMAYNKIPIDSSTKLDDKFMTMIEPYDYSDLVEFSMHYMTGFMAEKYDVEATTSQEVMRKRVEEFVESRLRSTVGTYTSYIPSEKSADLHDLQTNYALMPIFLLINKFKDKDHIFIVNGQTGKVVGETPIDTKKQLLFFGAVFAVTWIVTVLGGALFG